MGKYGVMKNSQKTRVCCVQPTGCIPPYNCRCDSHIQHKMQNLRIGIPEQPEKDIQLIKKGMASMKQEH